VGDDVPAPAPLDAERVQRIAAFRMRLRAFLRHSERAAVDFGLTPRQYETLLLVEGAASGERRLSFTDLTRSLQLSKNGVTELVARAEAAGLLQRETAQHDRRVVYLAATPEGRRRLAAALRASEPYRLELVAALEDLAALYRAAHRE
jgi:DNA-binding MarR family transcriptional regulator